MTESNNFSINVHLHLIALLVHEKKLENLFMWQNLLFEKIYILYVCEGQNQY